MKATDKVTSLKSGQPAKKLHQGAGKAQTLMRGALKKPAAGLSAKVQRLSPPVNYQRQARAQKVPRNSLVDRFGAPAGNNPSAPAVPTIKGEIIKRPAAQTTATSAPVLPSMVTSASHQKLERLLDEALTKADSHKQALKYQAARHFWQKPGFFTRHRGLKLSIAALIILGGGLFLAWQRFPQLSVKVAALRAHMAASVPAYQPDGYKMAAPATAQAGAVILKYKSAASGSGFDLTQKPSNMTSDNVAQTIVPKNTPVQTAQVNGNTVYIYGPHNDAAWVSGGVLYTIKDQTRLNPNDIKQIAQSLL